MRYCLFLFLFILNNCSTSPTGRKQLKYLPDEQMQTMGKSAFAQIKAEKGTVTKNSKDYEYVKCVTDALLRVMNENPKEWEIEIFKDDTPNAFALPGKKMGVHTGMLKLAQNPSQLAAVIGHEIAHVKAGHGNERASQQLLVQGGMAVAQIALGKDSQTDQMILGALGLGAQFGVLLPFSRTHESEADELGLKYLYAAGFDANQAPELWRVMSKQGGGSPPEFLSTHPSANTRIAKLSSQASQLLNSGAGHAIHPSCHP
jgi:predicted Zn-dependent protease